MTNELQEITFIPREYDIFGGLDVDKKSMAVTFRDHGIMRKSLKLPYSASQLLNYTRKNFPGQRVAFVYEAGPTGFGLHDELTAASHPCLVVSSRAVGCAVALALLAGGVSPLAAQTIACMVTGEPITSLDVEQRTKLNFLTTRKHMPKQEVLDELINEKVKLREAKRFGVDPSGSDVDGAYANMSQRMRC